MIALQDQNPLQALQIGENFLFKYVTSPNRVDPTFFWQRRNRFIVFLECSSCRFPLVIGQIKKENFLYEIFNFVMKPLKWCGLIFKNLLSMGQCYICFFSYKVFRNHNTYCLGLHTIMIFLSSNAIVILLSQVFQLGSIL